MFLEPVVRRCSVHRRLLALVLTAFALAACADGPAAVNKPAQVLLNFLTPATVRSVVVEVSGPGVSPAVVLNIPVGTDSVARGTLTLSAGAGRRFVLSAFDSAGVATHRADTTLALVAGANTPLAVRLTPLASTLGITVTFGGVRVSVPDTSLRVVSVGADVQISASATRPDGSAVPADSLIWATTNPAIATVDRGLVTARRLGQTVVVVGYGGVSARIPISVPTGGSSPGITTNGSPNVGASGMIALGNFGKPQVFSVSFWFKPVMAGGRHQILLDASHSGSTNWVYQYLGDGWCFLNACVTLTSDTWYHILLTYNNGTVKYFVNGTLRTTTAFTVSYSATAPTLYLGNWPVGSRQFAGVLDDLYITTDLQQTADFTPPITIGTPSANLFGLWRFNEGTGSQTLNSAGAALSLGIWTWTTRPF